MSDQQDDIKKKGSAEEIDIYVGERLKEIRKMQKVTQETLAGQIGISFQQVQKYENGKNRISVGRLYDISKLLKTPLPAFFDGFDGSVANAGLSDNAQTGLSGHPSDASNHSQEYVPKKEIDELVRVYYSLEDPELRKSFLNLGKNMAKNIKEQDS